MEQLQQITLNFSLTPDVVIEPDPESPNNAVRAQVRGLRSNGSVTQAAKILGCSRDTILRLIQAGEIEGYQPRQTGAKNCKYVVNLMTVWRIKQGH